MEHVHDLLHPVLTTALSRTIRLKHSMRISVVVATFNQLDRLRLVLTGLRAQSIREPFEIVVVDDGSSDGTADFLATQTSSRTLVCSLAQNSGRSIARNEGAARSSGELIVFLDGDALPHPDLLTAYWHSYLHGDGAEYFFGYHFTLPGVEFFKDPATGSLVDQPLLSVSMAEFLRRARSELVITEDCVRGRFQKIEGRAVLGAYPFPGNARMQRDLRELLTSAGTTSSAWVGFVPHNAAVPGDHFRLVGGFDPDIPFSEGMDLAYRLQQLGLRGRFVEGAKSYHLYHYHSFDTEEGTPARIRAVQHMTRKYRDPRIALVHLLYANYWPDRVLPERAAVRGFRSLERVFERDASCGEFQDLLHVVSVARPESTRRP